MARQRARNQELLNYYQANPFLLATLSSLSSKSGNFKKSISHVDSLHAVIDAYLVALRDRMKISPFNEILKSINESIEKKLATNKVSLVKAEFVFRYYIPDGQDPVDIKDYSNVLAAINEFNAKLNQAWEFLMVEDDAINLLLENFNEFSCCYISTILIQKFKQSSDYNDFQASLMCLAALLKVDFINLYAFSDSKKYSTELLKIKRKIFVRSTKEIKEEVLVLANDEADKEWEQGDYRLHYEMAIKILPKYKLIFKNKLLEAALYSRTKRVGLYRSEDKYQERVRVINEERGECKLTKEHIKKGIKNAAEKHHKYFDTGREYREKESYYK